MAGGSNVNKAGLFGEVLLCFVKIYRAPSACPLTLGAKGMLSFLPGSSGSEETDMPLLIVPKTLSGGETAPPSPTPVTHNLD